MTTIHTKLLLQPLADRKWLVAAPFVVDTDAMGLITIPAGFVTDLNSVPRFWWPISPATDYPEAGVVHDWLYVEHVDRALADKVYAELLTYLNAGEVRIATRYMLLRLFGGRAYNRHAPTKNGVAS